MASIKISGLPETTTVSSTDVMAVEGGSGSVKKVSLKNMKKYMTPEVSTHLGEVAAVDGNVIYMRAVVEKLSDSKCNIHGVLTFAKMEGEESYSLVSIQKMCDALGLSSLNITSTQSIVYCPAASATHRGYGMRFMSSGDNLQIGRTYGETGAAGGWSSSSPFMAAGECALFDIYGATYS